MKIEIEIHEHIMKELQFLVNLHKSVGAPRQCDSIQDLISYVLCSVADGSRRPGAWERELLRPMGLVADCWRHNEYRSQYGPEEEDWNPDMAPRRNKLERANYALERWSWAHQRVKDGDTSKTAAKWEQAWGEAAGLTLPVRSKG